MSFINDQSKEINCKIVYFGPALGGKSTSLRSIYNQVKQKSKGEMISLSTDEDRTLFFDFIPLNLGKVKDYTVRMHLYTVPGQSAYDAQRMLISKGVDGLVFVADSAIPRMESNLASLKDLQSILETEGAELSDIPFVIQYNKRDVKQAAPIKQMRTYLNQTDAPDFETVATDDQGVFDAFTTICTNVLQNLRNNS